MPPGRSGRPELLPAVHGVCGSWVQRNRRGYVTEPITRSGLKQIALVKVAADTVDVSSSAGGMREAKGCRMGRWCRRAARLVVIGEPEAVGRRADELLQRRSTANSFRVR